MSRELESIGVSESGDGAHLCDRLGVLKEVLLSSSASYRDMC